MRNHRKYCEFCAETQLFLLKKYGNPCNLFEFPEFLVKPLKNPAIFAENPIESLELPIKFVTFPSKLLKTLTKLSKTSRFSPFLLESLKKPSKSRSKSKLSLKSGDFSQEKGSFLKELEKHLEETSFESQEFSIYQPFFSSEEEKIEKNPRKLSKPAGFTEKMAHFTEDLWSYSEFLEENLEDCSVSQEKLRKSLGNPPKPQFLIKKTAAFSQKPLENSTSSSLQEKLSQMSKLLIKKPCIFRDKPVVFKEK